MKNLTLTFEEFVSKNRITESMDEASPMEKETTKTSKEEYSCDVKGMKIVKKDDGSFCCEYHCEDGKVYVCCSVEEKEEENTSEEDSDLEPSEDEDDDFKDIEDFNDEEEEEEK